MATKHDKLVTYQDELPLKKFHDPSVMWFFEVT